MFNSSVPRRGVFTRLSLAVRDRLCVLRCRCNPLRDVWRGSQELLAATGKYGVKNALTGVVPHLHSACT